jgi:hypothetical protein
VVRWWGVVWPIRRAERRLDEFDRVVLSEEVTEVGGHENLTYAVRLAGDGTPMDLQHTISPDAARLEAEAVARYADLPLHDETADEAVVRAASELDESVRERALREGARPDPGPPSEGSAVRCHVDADALVVELPRWRLGMAEWWAVVVFFIAWVVPVSVILAVQSERVGSDAAGVIFFSVLAFFFLLVPVVGLGVALLRHLTTRETLLVCPHVVELERRSLFGRREFDVSTAELEEVRCMPECLRLVTDRIAVEVGVGLEPEDLRWLQALVLAVATASDTRS